MDMATVQRNTIIATGDPVKEAIAAKEACSGLLREIRSRGQRSCATPVDTRMLGRTFAVLARLFQSVHGGRVRLARETPSSVDDDSAIIMAAYPPCKDRSDGPYRVSAIHACEAFVGPRAPWAPDEIADRHFAEVMESRFKTLRGSLGMPPGTLFARMETTSHHLLHPDDRRSVQARARAIATAHRTHVLAHVLSYDSRIPQKALTASRIRREVASEVADRAASGLECALVELIALLYAGRWQAVARALPMTAFLSDHALLGVRGSIVLVLYG